MIPRILEKTLKEYAQLFPLVAVLGPRQSGKTTLCQYSFPQKPYVTLESPDHRDMAKTDPRGFLAQYPEGAILDEVQHAPELFSYLQEIVDHRPEKGLFLLTGSQNILLSQKISQSLAGRIALLNLLPLSRTELQNADLAPQTIWEQVWKGGYPRLYAEKMTPNQWLPFYVQTYLEKDIRSLVDIGNLTAFSQFLRLLAAHTAQELHYNTLSNDLGLSHNTIRRWTSLLEESYLLAFLPPWHSNIKKRIVKSPKLHFLDTGLACSLLGITSPQQLQLHPLRGALFESWVFGELWKQKQNRLSSETFYHYRENNGIEFDLVVDTGMERIPYEIKSAQTVSSSFFKHFLRLQKREKPMFSTKKGGVIFAGDVGQQRSDVPVFSWKALLEW